MVEETVLAKAGIDYEVAYRRFDGHKDIFEKYLKRYLSDVHFKNAKERYDAKDYNGVASELHPLKAITGMLGMTELFSACEEIINSIRALEYEDIDNQFTRVKNANDAIMTALANEIF